MDRFQSDRGRSKTLVFLHYFGGAARSWDLVTARLQDRFHCVPLDLPGFGSCRPLENLSLRGFARHVLNRLRELDISECCLIGHSMGAKIALLSAVESISTQINELILVAPSPPTIEPMPEEEKERMLVHPDREVAAETVRRGTKINLPPEIFQMAIETQLIVEEKTWEWWLKEGMAHSIANSMDCLTANVTLISSKDDSVITPKVIKEKVLSVLKPDKSITTEGVGHLIPLEKPEWLSEQLKKILA